MQVRALFLFKLIPKLQKNDDWDLLIESIWEYQWLQNKVELTDELNQAIYNESQGIVDIAVKLLLEVAVPDNRSLSTLIIPSKGIIMEDEVTMRTLLTKLVFTSGSWSQSFLYNLQNIRVKHLQESYQQWAARLIKIL